MEINFKARPPSQKEINKFYRKDFLKGSLIGLIPCVVGMAILYSTNYSLTPFLGDLGLGLIVLSALIIVVCFRYSFINLFPLVNKIKLMQIAIWLEADEGILEENNDIKNYLNGIVAQRRKLIAEEVNELHNEYLRHKNNSYGEKRYLGLFYK